MLKNIFFFSIYILLIVIIIPLIFIFVYNKEYENLNINNFQNVVDYLEFENDTNNSLINSISIPFEEYIVGVVAAEMPVSFEEEALKAQAIASRTYAYRRIEDINEEVDYTKIGQAYISVEDLKSKWGDNFDTYYAKIYNAVYSTKGLIMTYDGEAIEAVFHSTSAGVTEDAENVWGNSLPYIKSVDSKQDENAPNFIYNTVVSNEEFINKILEKLPDIDKDEIINSFEITKTSDAGYVLEVTVCQNTIAGKDIRTMFDLRSTNFTIQKNEDNITFTTKGYGHGAGMSQYGAEFMAKEGKTYEEILNHYYSGITIEKIY